VTVLRVTNAVLRERIDQQHTQVMLSLTRVEDKLTTLCSRVQGAEVVSAEDRARIAVVETRQATMQADLSSVKKRTLRLVIAVAVLSGASSVAADRVLGLLLP